MVEAVRVETRPTIREFVALIDIFREEFEQQNFPMPSEEYLHELLLKEDFIVFVAILNNQVVGGMTGYILHTYYLEGAYFYIYDLAVHREHQRKGIGTMLIKAVKDEFCNTNITDVDGFRSTNNPSVDKFRNTKVSEVFVQAESIDDHAIEFYRSTGAAEQNVLGFTYDLR